MMRNPPAAVRQRAEPFFALQHAAAYCGVLMVMHGANTIIIEARHSM